MRKLLVLPIAAIAAIVLAGVAYAANVYTVGGGTKPAVKGSAKKPVPVSLDFSYTVADENSANRGIPVKEYRIDCRRSCYRLGAPARAGRST